ncbi:uncharacterized protein LOC107884503 isoform X2 [Acyrthosiphon pisum]|uniref:Uncharacterized protein n=1 Tax=Acyrthosiphon pisum TaxID=7029 RepID=A0A8R2JP39_ACYPI|nr:uncharacterized protein LOC107884503 isoform X2 [Acyrthosiphon pisum]|eukprot:XP_016662242.1 PREDICTED: uncharacterized protein LOC107884503 [Acyrthosiphon pisum]
MIFESYKFEECPKKLHVIKKRGRFAQTPTLPNKCYERKLPISSAKFKDLSDLCKNGIIPEKFHAEYYDMNSSETIRDCLDESDIEDSDVSDDY